MTILLLGSRGKTGTQLLRLLQPTYPVLGASRTPALNSPHPVVRFDWKDATTWALPFSHEQAARSPITTVYIVGIDERDMGERGIRFIEFARARGVKRFVAVSAWEQPGSSEGPLMAPVHAELRRLGKEVEGFEWAVLRPHFFMENFSEGYHPDTIKQSSKIYSATGSGKLPFVSAHDIAAVGFRALTDENSHNTDHYITGGEALNYDEVAAILTRTLGREITHVSLGREEFRRLLEREATMGSWMAGYMTDLDGIIAAGDGAEVKDTVERVTGRRPRTFEEYSLEEKATWS